MKTFYQFIVDEPGGCDVCGCDPVQLHHVLLHPHGRRGHDLDKLNVLKLCMRCHQTGQYAAHKLKQHDFFLCHWGSAELVWQFMFARLGRYTLYLEELWASRSTSLKPQ